MSPREIVTKGFWLGVLATVLCAGTFFAYVAWYTGTDRILPGVTVGQFRVGGLTPGAARGRLAGTMMSRRPPLTTAGATAGNPVGGTGGVPPQRRPAQPVLGETAATRLHWGDKVWSLPARTAGAVPDVQGAVQTAAAIGRDGSLWERTQEFLVGMVHGHYVPLEPNVREQALRNQLEAIARQINRQPVNARFDFESGNVTEDAAGKMLDVPATVKAVRRAVLDGRADVDLVVKETPPAVSRDDVMAAQQVQLARFTTPILAAELGRVQNITLALRKLSGVVVAPGQVFSFNEVEGPRDATHGWAQAKELYQGEFVTGYGGGICQVSSTLYNAVLLAGLEIKTRTHHDRPLQYIEPGRDATVVWGQLDFQFRNNTDVPILIRGQVLPGQPQQIEVTLHASRPVVQGAVKLETADIKYLPPDMTEVEDPALSPDTRQVLDEGNYGIEVKVYRTFESGDQQRRELVSHDRYNPKPGKVRVGVRVRQQQNEKTSQ